MRFGRRREWSDLPHNPRPPGQATGVPPARSGQRQSQAQTRDPNDNVLELAVWRPAGLRTDDAVDESPVDDDQPQHSPAADQAPPAEDPDPPATDPAAEADQSTPRDDATEPVAHQPAPQIEIPRPRTGQPAPQTAASDSQTATTNSRTAATTSGTKATASRTAATASGTEATASGAEATASGTEAASTRTGAAPPQAELPAPRTDAGDPLADQSAPQADARPRQDDRPDPVGQLLAATRAQITCADREYIGGRAEIIESVTDERTSYRAAEEIWTHAATLVVRAIPTVAQRRSLADGLQLWIWHGLPAGAIPPQQRALVEGFFGVMHGLVREILRGLARDTAIRTLLPDSPAGAPPLGFTDAIFTACELLEHQPVG